LDANRYIPIVEDQKHPNLDVITPFSLSIQRKMSKNHPILDEIYSTVNFHPYLDEILR